MAKNMLSAYSIASVYGISDTNIEEALANFKFPKGRVIKYLKMVIVLLMILIMQI